MPGKQYNMEFRLNAGIGSDFNAVFQRAQREILAVQKDIDALSRTQADVAAYQKQQDAAEATQKKLDMLRQQYDNIQKEMSETEGFSSSLENRLLSKQHQIDNTTKALDRQTQALDRMETELREAGIDTTDLGNASAKLEKDIEGLRKKQEEAADGASSMGSRITDAFGAAGNALAAAGITAGLEKIAGYIRECTDASVEFESAMTGVAKTTDLTDAELAAMGRDIKQLATEIPVTTSELAGVGEVAGQLGIAKDNLLDFSVTMAKLSTATSMTADNAATMLAQFANITQMDPADYERLGSTIVDLGNNYATTEQKITDMSQGMAASASLAGMAETDILGIAAAVSSLGIEAQAGSTSMSKLISEIMVSVELGDDKLAEFARIANMSADEFAAAWRDNAAGALEKFITGLSDTERLGQSSVIILQNLGITETRLTRAVLSLANSGDLLTRAIATANTAWDENVALQNEAEKRYATTESRLTMMQNAYNNLKIAVGDNFTPALSGLYGVGTDVLNGMTKFVEENPRVVKAATAAVGVIGTVTAAVAGYNAVAKIAKMLDIGSLFAGMGAALPIAAVAALTAGIIAFAASADDAEAEVRSLSATSRKQYYEMRDLQRQYEEVSASMGENSHEAKILRADLELATKAYADNKETAEEYAAKMQEIHDAYIESRDAYNDIIEGIDKEELSSTSLIAKLEELVAEEGKTAEAKKQILTIVEMLNDKMPELGLAYDEYSNSLNMTSEALHALIEAEIARKRNEANYNALYEAMDREAGLEAAKTAAINERIAAEQELARARREAEKYLPQYNGTNASEIPRNISAEAQAAYNRLARAQQAFNDASAAEKQATEDYESNKAAIEELTAAIVGYEEASEASGGGIVEAVRAVGDSLGLLADGYEETYAAAQMSLEGQYKLWDSVAGVTATSAASMMDAIQSQTQYWTGYNENLKELYAYTDDIPGLRLMLASFADGSKESVAAVAGLAEAARSDVGALKNLVSQWSALREAQTGVAESLALFSTDYEYNLGVIEQSIAETIAGMDMGSASYSAARETLLGYLDGVEDMLPEVAAMYRRVVYSGLNTLEEVHAASIAPSRQELMMTPHAYASGTTAAAAGWALVGERGPELMRMRGGETVLSARDTSAVLGGGYGGGTVVEFAPVYNISGGQDADGIRSVLEEHDAEMRDYILEVVNEAAADAGRRDYR